MNKGISIITNFGCDNNCWYCIWKKHKLRYCKEQTNWVTLIKFLQDNENKGKVSISGGGDPLYAFYRNMDWWGYLFNVARQLNFKVDVHTRKMTHYYLNGKIFWGHINRVSYSFDIYTPEVEADIEQLLQLTKVRLVHIVTEKTSLAFIDILLNIQATSGCQITLKELVGHDDKGRYKELKDNWDKYPNILFLDVGDYNIYYMPDNKVYKTFMCTEEGE